MNRISTLAQNQLMLRNALSTQERLFDLQKQISSGEKTDTFKGLRSDSVVLTTAKSRIARLEQLEKNNIQTKAKLDLRENAVRSIVEIAKDLKAEYIKAEGVADGAELQRQTRVMLEQVVATLNTKDHSGAYLFGGSRTNKAPVGLTASGAPPPAFTVTFNNDTIIEQANIENNVTINVGVLAATDPTTPSGDFVPLIDILNHFAAGFFPPPFAAQPLPPAGTAPPDQIIPLLNQAFDLVNNVNADLGIKQALVEEANLRLQLDIDLTTEFITQVKDVDIAEAVTRINQEQVALEATFRITGNLQGLSLVNFI